MIVGSNNKLIVNQQTMKAMAQAWLDDHMDSTVTVVVNGVHYLSATSEFQILLEEKMAVKQTLGG